MDQGPLEPPSGIDDRANRLTLPPLTEPIGSAFGPRWRRGRDPSAPPRFLAISRPAEENEVRRFPIHLAVLFGSALLTGCTVGPDWKAPHMWAPTGWFGHTKASMQAGQAAHKEASEPVLAPVDPKWWTILHDAELTALEQRVTAANLNLRIASMRLAESRLQRRITGADQYPTLQADGSYTGEKISSLGVIGILGGGSSGGSFASTAGSANGLGGRSNGIPTAAAGVPSIPSFSLWQYGFDASWELDLWGRVRREVESADANVAASADQRRSSVLSVVAEVARDYVMLRGIQEQLRITQENIGTARQSLDLTQARFRGGLTTDLDVANAAAQLANTEAEVPQLEQSRDEQINALSFLLGEGPQALRAELITPQVIPPVPPAVPVGVPSELARRRPDIRQAEDQLHAATAEIGVAIGDFYPKFSIEASGGLQALKFTELADWDAHQYGIGPTITLPIFEGGRLRATLQLRKSEQQEAALNYQQTVLQAWHDVDNALTAYAKEQHRRDALSVSVEQNRKALDLSRQRYTQGVADFLNVLDSERSLLAAELQLAESTTTVSENLVQLYKALGGGWETEFPTASNTNAHRD
jgi:NodT family efflux transporter outer membrane factor (OMF) lipoprotein